MTATASPAHYTLLRPIGAGGMGEVFLARDERLGRDVALKRLPATRAGDPHAVERFKREARAASALSHPNIVTVFEVGESADGWFLAMEFVRGETLATARGADWPLPRIAEALRQCALALATAHDAGIVHRDIKPENVMVRDDGYVKLLDFGLARLFTERTGSQGGRAELTLTEPGMLIGTLGYLSPEQASGDAVGPASDIFSLGIIAYELSTGTHPFLAPTQVAMLGAILSRELPAPQSLRDDLPAAFDELVRAMLARPAAARPTAREVADRLRTFTSLAGPSDTVVRLGTGREATGVDASAPTSRTGALRPGAEPSAARLVRQSGVVVGRAHDLATIQAVYADVLRGHGELVSVAGEPGIGKTTLVESALSTLAVHDTPPLVARGRCSERLAGTEAYLPILEALEAALASDASGAIGALLARTAPSWNMLLGRVTSADGTPAALASQERLKREMAALLEQAAAAAPVVFFLDDVHWADASTVDLLAYLGARFDRLRVLVLCTYRDAELRAGHHPFLQVQRELAARGHVRELSVALLGEPAVRDFIDRTYPHHDFPSDFARVVHARTEGSPLFVADLLRWLGARGVIAEQAGRWSLVRPVPEVDRDLPGSVRSMIERKIAQLDEGDRKLLAAAAVQGAECDTATIAAILSADEADVEEQLLVLDKVYAFVRRVEDATYPDRSHAVRYRFVHALYQNVLVADLAPSRRASWSAKAADFLEQRHRAKAPEIAAELAALRAAARQPERAAQWYAVAAQQAMAVFAYAEAEALAGRGLAQAEQIDEPAARGALELPLRVMLGTTSLVRRGFAAPETAENMGTARAMCEAISGEPTLAVALWVLILYSIAHGELATAARLCAQLLDLGESSGDPAILACGHLVHVGLNTHRGNVAEGLAAMARTDAIADDAVTAALRARFQPDPILTARCEQVRLLWLADRPDEAQRVLDGLFRYVARTGDPQGRAFIGLFAAELAVMRSDAAQGERHARDAIAICEEHGIASERLWNTLILGLARARQGALAEGIALMQRVLEVFHGIESFVTVPFFQAHLADALLASGDVAGAQAAVTTGFAVADRTGEHAWDAALWMVQAAILRADATARGDALTPDETVARAERAAATCGAPALLRFSPDR